MKLRPWLRAMHRDAGYFVVGFTLIYALSGLAVNHIADWDPNFHQIHREHRVSLPARGNDREITAAVLGELGVKELPRESYRASESALEIVFDDRTFHVDTRSGVVLEEGQSPRFFLRLANYLHLNRGKKAWTYVADLYAVLLIVLAISGLFMIPGRKGLVGRGAVIALAGAAIPALYVILTGTP
ncbi:MAG TPA: PepSY-associated TM helix domain-containing protein [Polyangiaceae bacterium]